MYLGRKMISFFADKVLSKVRAQVAGTDALFPNNTSLSSVIGIIYDPTRNSLIAELPDETSGTTETFQNDHILSIPKEVAG